MAVTLNKRKTYFPLFLLLIFEKTTWKTACYQRGITQILYGCCIFAIIHTVLNGNLLVQHLGIVVPISANFL